MEAKAHLKRLKRDIMGTVKGQSPDNFFANDAAEKLKRALRGLATDEKVIIEVLTQHSYHQRIEIREAYSALHGKDLVVQFRNELGGHFLEACLSLVRGDAVNDAISLNNAIKKLKEVAESYLDRYGQTLEYDLSRNCRSRLKSLFLALLHGRRDDFDYADGASAGDDATILTDNSVHGFLLPRSEFIKVASHRSHEQMRKVIQEYELKSGQSINAVIEKRVTNDTRASMLALIECIKEPVGFYAMFIHECMRGVDSDDSNFIRLIVSRSEADLQLIIDEYGRRYKESLMRAILRNCSGDYCRIMLRLIGETTL